MLLTRLQILALLEGPELPQCEDLGAFSPGSLDQRNIPKSNPDAMQILTVFPVLQPTQLIDFPLLIYRYRDKSNYPIAVKAPPQRKPFGQPMARQDSSAGD